MPTPCFEVFPAQFTVPEVCPLRPSTSMGRDLAHVHDIAPYDMPHPGANCMLCPAVMPCTKISLATKVPRSLPKGLTYWIGVPLKQPMLYGKS